MTATLPPLFLGGAGRSGTTLLVDLLGTHPELSPIYETDFVLDLLGVLEPSGESGVTADGIRRTMDEWTRTLPHRPHSKRPYERYHHGPHHVLFDRSFALERLARLLSGILESRARESLREYLDALFGEHARIDGKPYWINKTPRYASVLARLHRVFPDFRFVHIIRDGRDVACSVLTRPWGPRTVGAAACWWRDNVRAVLDFETRNPERVVTVRYEALVADPKSTVIDAWHRIGLDPAPASTPGAPAPDSSRVGIWRTELSPAQHAMFRASTGDLLEQLGYP